MNDARGWDTEYREGKWDHLRDLPEISRHAVIAGYCRTLLRRKALLDLGCGEGTLYPFLDPRSVSRYVGVDISKVAIEKARRQHKKAKFYCAAAEELKGLPFKKFDVIVCNEMLYCTENPGRTIKNLLPLLSPKGIFIVSMCEGIDEEHDHIVENIWATLQDGPWNELAQTVISTKGVRCRWRVTIYRKKR